MDEEEQITLVSGGERITDRRAANFEVTDESANSENDEIESEESDDELLGPEGLASDSENEDSEMSENDEDDEIREIQREIEGYSGSEEESDTAETELRWKDGMQEKASQAFYKRQSTSVNLKELGALINKYVKDQLQRRIRYVFSL